MKGNIEYTSRRDKTYSSFFKFVWFPLKTVITMYTNRDVNKYSVFPSGYLFAKTNKNK